MAGRKWWSPPHLAGPLGFELTWEKLYYAAGIVMRMVGIALVSIPLTFTTQPHDYGVGFKGIGLPDKFAVAIDLALRLVPTFASDFQSTLDAQRARGYETEALRGGPIAKLRRMSPIVVPVTIGAIVSGEDIINAMDLRAFGSGPRTWSRKRERHPRRPYAHRASLRCSSSPSPGRSPAGHFDCSDTGRRASLTIPCKSHPKFDVTARQH